MAEWSIASDLKSDELNRFREFESHFLLKHILVRHEQSAVHAADAYTEPIK